MSIHNLDRIFKPKSVAVIGASENVDSIGAAIMRNLTTGDFKGDIYPVNPRYRKINGKKSYKKIEKVPSPPDLVILATPIQSAPDLVNQCATLGCGGAIIIAAGGKEIGEEGATIESQIKHAAQNNNFRIIGPNCLGIISSQAGLNASFANAMPIPGKLAFVSQSGAICSSILDFSLKEHIGFSYFASLGSMLDVDFGDVIDYLGSDPEVSSILMYVENLTRFRNFMSAARAVSRVKPIVVLKAGRTAPGAKAAASHTGALASEDAVYDVALKRSGIVRVKTFQELFDCAEFLSKQPPLSGSDLAIVTNAGGPGVMATDCLSDYGLEPATLSQQTLRRLDHILPPAWSHANPVDILGDASAERYGNTVEILINAKEVKGLLIMLSPQTMTRPTKVADVLINLLQNKKLPVFTAWMGGLEVEAGKKRLNQAGISTYDTPERAVRAFVDLHKYSQNIEMLQQIPPSLPGTLKFDKTGAYSLIQTGLERESGLLTETESKQLLSAYGLPVNSTINTARKDDAVALAEKIGYPVVMKIDSPDIVHKSDAGTVVLNIQTAEEIRAAFDRIMANAQSYNPEARVNGVSIQKMITAFDYKLIIGAKTDRDFGPVLLFGMGGIHTELFQDKALALPPLNRLLVKRMMEETKIYKALNGYRNQPGVNVTLLEEMMIRLSQLMTDFSEINTVDMNPVFVTTESAVAVDARVIITPPSKPAPLHLVISPYPNQLESLIVLKGVGQLLIRPVRPEDAPLVVDLFNQLSAQSIYYRFFSPMKKLPHYMLARFTQIDYDREIALAAVLQSEEGQGQLIGMARVIPEHNRENGEFAVLVGDQWHGKGVGAALLKRCLEIASLHDIKNIYGEVLTDNTKMIALGKKLGFLVKRQPGSDTYRLTRTFSK